MQREVRVDRIEYGARLLPLLSPTLRRERVAALWFMRLATSHVLYFLT